jgi:hypothetical protein
VFITAVNEGAAAVKGLLSTAVVVRTMVEGFVQLEDGTLVSGAEVSTDFGATVVGGPDGFFSLPAEFPSETAGFRVTALAQIGEERLVATSSVPAIVAGGITDVGILTIQPAPPSCLAILRAGRAAGNGRYWIAAPSGVYETHCDFSTDGGGWTRVGALDGSQSYCTTTGFTDMRLDPDASAGKVPDADVQAIMSDTPGSPHEVMYFIRGSNRYVWHALQSVGDFDTSRRHTSASFYCSNWHCDNGTVDSSACGSEGDGCPVTAHGRPFGFKKIYVDSSFSAHARGFHSNGGICGLPNFTRASTWVYVR